MVLHVVIDCCSKKVTECLKTDDCSGKDCFEFYHNARTYANANATLVQFLLLLFTILDF